MTLRHRCCFCSAEAVPWEGAAHDAAVIACAQCQEQSKQQARNKKPEPVVDLAGHHLVQMLKGGRHAALAVFGGIAGLGGPLPGQRIH
jgi:hypothetical protein